MVLSESKLEYLFNIYNGEYFHNSLPVPEFKVIHKNKTFGRFECRVGWKSISQPVIMVTDKYNFTEEQLRDIMVHEMIHYYLAYKRIDRIITHGKAFKEMMNDFNLNEGLNIQITYNPKDFEVDKNKETTLEKVSNFIFG
jgi:hypothetical protein